VSTQDWVVAIARVLVVLSLIQGARRGWRRRHIEPAGSQLGTAVATIAFIVYFVAGVVGLIWYGIFIYPRFVLLAVPAAMAYGVGGWRLVGVIGCRVQRAYETRARKAA
jgi:apolipoprotein N-acyltransferase